MTDILAGLYVLTASGELGVYDEQRQLHVDEPLSRMFSEHNRAFLHAHRQDPHGGDRRSAVLFEARQARAWGRFTLSLEDIVVRGLYPAGGRAASGLTAFQQKNREMSVYRGLELLIEHRRESTPEVPVYCPVLFDPQTTLAQRSSAIGREPDELERGLTVLDVLNLAATLPPARRAAPEILTLVDKLRQGVIRKDLRRDSPWSLLQEAKRVVTQPAAELARLHELERISSIERWLKVPHQPVGSERLHGFVQFRGLDNVHLDEFIAPSLIYSAPAGALLLEQGQSDAWNFYLLEGALNLIPADGTSLRVEGGTDKATRSIASLKPRKYRVEALTAVNFLWVHDRVIAALADGTARPTG